MNLTERQRSLVELASLGMPDKQIADQLGCSPHTVKEHWRRLFLRLGIHSRGEAIFRLAVTQAGDHEKATCGTK